MSFLRHKNLFVNNLLETNSPVNNLLFLVTVSCCLYFSPSFALSDYARSKGFVQLSEVDSTILTSLRYFTNENFLGTPVDGYKKDCVVMTLQAAQALKKVQEEVKKDGYYLLVYDAYRPQQAVDHFARWATNISDQQKKSQYYPRINKYNVFDLGYIAKRSGHSRGSTVDLTLIKDGKKSHAIIEKKRILLDGFEIKFLDDGTVDMGSSFDLFDLASHPDSGIIKKSYKKIRTYFRKVMEKYGFIGSVREWWHFTLKNEPYPADQDSSYFNFAIE